MTIEELIEKMKEQLTNTDYEGAHIRTDELLLEYIDNEEVSKLHYELAKWFA